jgi:UDP-N-acetylglucosamine---dolichyl-phosphate N-acetylglucosaminyltransferase
MNLPELDKTLVIIPAYNEERLLGKVIKDLKDSGFKNVLVINDGSSDNTVKIAEKEDVFCLSHTINMGVGAALRTGFSWSVKKNKYKYIVMMDADGQHSVGDALKVLEKTIRGNFDLVNGTRNFNNKNSPRFHRLVNYLSDILTFAISGKYITDTQSGLKCITVESLKKIQLKSAGYTICSEIIIEAVRNNLSIRAEHIESIYTEYSQSKAQRQRIMNSWHMVKKLLS